MNFQPNYANNISGPNTLLKTNLYSISDFDCCQLIEQCLKANSKCVVCGKAKKKINVTLMCSTCNICCCVECYDIHRKTTFISNLRKFQLEKQVTTQLSKCGNFIETKLKTERKKFLSLTKQEDNVENDVRKNNGENDMRKDIVETLIDVDNFSSDSDFPTSSVPSSKVLTFTTIKPAVSLLQENYGVFSELMFDIEGKFKCMYFQDRQMKDFFSFYPKRICIDVTCTLVSLNLILYLFLSEDSNGQSEIISAALVSVEDVECLAWLLNMFKKHNPCWRETKMLIADSLIRNREILRSCFPDTHILICFYHSTRTFKRDLDSIKVCSIPNDEKNSLIKLFEEMVLAYSEMEYSLLYQQLFSTFGYIQDYFNNNWHIIRHEWRIRMDYCDNILYAINGFLNFIENSVKPILSVQTTLYEFVKKFFFILKLLRIERSQKNPLLFRSIQLSLYSKFTPQYHISNVLTPYSAEFVINQLDISAEININPGVLLESYIFCRFGTTAVANSSTCTCKFFLLTSLFCCHIFAVRRVLSLVVFDAEECDITWTQKYFQDAYTSLEESSSQYLQSSSNYSLTVSDRLTSVMLNCVSKVFEHRMALLDQLIESWKKGKEVYLQFNGIELAEFQNIQNNSFLNVVVHPNDLISDVKEDLIHSEPHSSNHLITLTDLQNDIPHLSKPSFLVTDWKCGKHLLEGSHINFAYLSHVICKTKESCIEWLQYMELLPKSMICPACGYAMKHESAIRLSDGVIWICTSTMKNRKSCAKRCSVRRGTWFEATNMTLEQILFFAYMWINFYPASQIIFELGISSATFTVWEKNFRRVCWSTLQNSHQGMDLNSKQVVDVWLQSKHGQDEFVMFLKDASILHSEDRQSIQCI